MTECKCFGTTHVDYPRKVTDELREFADDADILFIESPRGDDYEYEMIVRNPALYITGVTLECIWAMLGFILTWQFTTVDTAVTKKVAQENNLDIEPVDMNIPRKMSEVSPIVTVVSWLWTGVVAFVFVLSVWYTSIVVLGYAVLFALLPTLPFSQLTLSERDKVMAENIEEILSTDDKIKKGCFVAGRDHIDGVEKQLEESSVQVTQTFKSKWLRHSL